jgi:hypothetical protein
MPMSYSRGSPPCAPAREASVTYAGKQSDFITTKTELLSWVGGKSLLAKEIIPLIPKHQCYGEVFAGAAW